MWARKESYSLVIRENKKTLNIWGLIRSIGFIIKFINRIIKFSDPNIYHNIKDSLGLGNPFSGLMHEHGKAGEF